MTAISTPVLKILRVKTQVELEDAEEVLKIVQNFDPFGVGSRNLQECLSIQANSWFHDSP